MNVDVGNIKDSYGFRVGTIYPDHIYAHHKYKHNERLNDVALIKTPIMDFKTIPGSVGALRLPLKSLKINTTRTKASFAGYGIRNVLYGSHCKSSNFCEVSRTIELF